VSSKDFSQTRISSKRDIFLFVSEDDQVEVLTENGLRLSFERFQDRFEELEPLGEGTVGLVKRCRELATDREFAVKIIQTRDDEMVLNLKAEFEHVARLSQDNVVRVYELIVDRRNGTVHLIMELFDGQELFVLLAEVGHYDGGVIRDCGQGTVPTTALWDDVPPQARGHPPRPQAQQHPGGDRGVRSSTQNN
jgi:hypothetical protein